MVDSSFHIPAVDTLVENSLDFNWSIAPIPSVLERPRQNVFGASLSVPDSSPENELAAWLFIKYFTSPEVQAAWSKNTNFLPIRMSSAEPLSDYFDDNSAYHAAFELMPYGTYEPSLPGYDFIRQEVELALEAILDGEEISLTLEALNAIANQVYTIHFER
jgi:multiple sugar transport system substrate-binding protein/sn-glycerol 3-phosphate transport system substrate-binding protein